MSGLYRLAIPDRSNVQAAYLAARAREGLELDLASVRALPVVDARHAHARLWRLRAHSADWLVTRLRARQARRVLDLGCGTGWLAALLARATGASVCALDTHLADLELGQAAFADVPSLTFCQGDVFAPAFDALVPEGRFDTVVMAGVAPYFPDLARLFVRLFELLAEHGELLLVDSPFWPAHKLVAARARTRRHYEALGRPDALAGFHHHTLAELEAFGARFHYRPEAWSARLARVLLRRPLSPFPRVSVPHPGAARP